MLSTGTVAWNGNKGRIHTCIDVSSAVVCLKLRAVDADGPCCFVRRRVPLCKIVLSRRALRCLLCRIPKCMLVAHRF